MLTVPVAADDEVVAALSRVLEPGLYGAADAEVERQPDDVRTVRRRDLGGAVDGPVRDDDDLQVRGIRAQLLDHGADVVLLVERRHDGDPAKASVLSRHEPPHG